MANDGSLSCGLLREVEVELQSRWTNNTYADTRGIVKDGTVQALFENQTAYFEELSDNTNKNQPKVKLYWLEDCPIDVQACNVSCDAPAGGVEFGDNCMDVEVTQCIEAETIMIDEHKLADSKYDASELVARGVARAEQAIVEELNRRTIGILDGAVQANLNTDDFGGLVTPAAAAGDCSVLDGAIWTDPYNYFTMTETLNNYTSPYFVGGSLYSKFAIEAARANGNFSGEGLTTVNGYPFYFDLRAMDQELSVLAGAPTKKLFMLNRGEFAFVNAYTYPEVGNRMEFDHNNFGYRLQSPILSSYLGRAVYFDVDYWVKCQVTNGIKRKVHCWQIRLRYDIVQSPADCDGNNRVLCFTCA